MKESAGEANLTVIAIILIAVVVAIATPLVGSLMKRTVYRSCCTDAGMLWKGGYCMASSSTSCDEIDNVMWPEYVACTKETDSSTRADLYYRKNSSCRN